MTLVHAASIALLCIILRRSEAGKQDELRFGVMYSTWLRKVLLFVVILGYFANFTIAFLKTFVVERDFRVYNKYSAWINVEAISFLVGIIYFLIVKF